MTTLPPLTAAERLAEIRMRVDAISDENPFSYDPWDDDSVDPTNTGDVVHAAVSRGWDAGVKAEAPSLVAALEAVLELHCEDDYGSCRYCTDGLEGTPYDLSYPCPTVEAVNEALGDPR